MTNPYVYDDTGSGIRLSLSGGTEWTPNAKSGGGITVENREMVSFTLPSFGGTSSGASVALWVMVYFAVVGCFLILFSWITQKAL